MKEKRFSRGRIRPLFFSRPLSSKDLAMLASWMKARAFDPAVASGVAVRCSRGNPAVITCRSIRDNKPFPTAFWLTCPWLVHLCGRLESEGAIELLERDVKSNQPSWVSYHMRAARLRILSISPMERRFLHRFRKGEWRSLSLGGVGGIRYQGGGGAKCLHLQVAYWLAVGFHPAEELLERMVRPLECEAPSKWGCQ
ncbi:MAG: DUF501 domain-containing protein [Synergistota bacterium]|nr:DUF501 domain-containing protein [Synergistota bacterium]